MMHNPENRHGLALIGLRGTGKTTVGRILAERLGRTFADADVELEQRVGRPIRAIFAELGEPAFRDWEERVLADLTSRDGLVLATGGGAILRPVNRQRLRAFGFVAWLSTDTSVIAGRLLADPDGVADRPSLTASGTVAELAEVLGARAALYRETADAVIDTGRLGAVAVADAVLDAWRNHGRECRE